LGEGRLCCVRAAMAAIAVGSCPGKPEPNIGFGKPGNTVATTKSNYYFQIVKM